MDLKKRWQAKVDEEGRLILSPEFVSHYGLKPQSLPAPVT